jgi:hypothetical protein
MSQQAINPLLANMFEFNYEGIVTNLKPTLNTPVSGMQTTQSEPTRF